MRKLQKKQGARKALLKNLVKSLILHERITTTVAKAKETRSLIERLIERGKKRDLTSRRYLLKYLSKNTASKVIDVISPRFSAQKGGCVQIFKIGPRAGDHSPLAILKFKEVAEKEVAEKENNKSNPIADGKRKNGKNKKRTKE